jgi:hypothetical protein
MRVCRGPGKWRRPSSYIASAIDLDACREAGHEADGQWIADESDFDRNPLNDTNEIPRRVIRGEQTEGRSTPRRDTVHLAFKHLVRIRVDSNAGALPGPDRFDLGFLEIRDNPHVVERDDIEQGGSGRDKPTDADLAIAHNAADRRTHHSIIEIDSGEITRGPRLCDASNRGLSLGGKDSDTLLLGFYRC